MSITIDQLKNEHFSDALSLVMSLFEIEASKPELSFEDAQAISRARQILFKYMEGGGVDETR